MFKVDPENQNNNNQWTNDQDETPNESPEKMVVDKVTVQTSPEKEAAEKEQPPVEEVVKPGGHREEEKSAWNDINENLGPKKKSLGIDEAFNENIGEYEVRGGIINKTAEKAQNSGVGQTNDNGPQYIGSIIGEQFRPNNTKQRKRKRNSLASARAQKLRPNPKINKGKLPDLNVEVPDKSRF
ncbi:hypothetical protein Hanom_Chr09g00785621 [Helianthus anomalus]